MQVVRRQAGPGVAPLSRTGKSLALVTSPRLLGQSWGPSLFLQVWMPTSQRLCLGPGWAGLRVWPGFACAAPVGLGNSAGLATPCGVTPVGKLGSCCSHGDWASVALTEPSPGAEAPSSLSCSACATVPLAEVSPMARLRFHSLRALGTEPQAYTGTTCFALASQPSLVAWHRACTHPVASGFVGTFGQRRRVLAFVGHFVYAEHGARHTCKMSKCV